MKFKIFRYTFQIARTVPFETDNNDFPPSVEEVQTAIEYAKQNAEGFPRAGIPLIFNGTITNNDWISYSNLTPSVPIPWAVKTKINELTWANSETRDNRSFDLQIFKLVGSVQTLVKTLEVRNSPEHFGYWENIDVTFNPGEAMRIRYIDKGKNCADLCLVPWFSRVV